MKKLSKFGWVVLLSVVFPALDGLAIGGGDTEVFIDPKEKAPFSYAPDPEFTQAAERRGMHGQGIYKLIIKNGGVDEVKVLHHAGRDLDASAIFTFFKWKPKPGVTSPQEILVDFRLSRYFRQTR